MRFNLLAPCKQVSSFSSSACQPLLQAVPTGGIFMGDPSWAKTSTIRCRRTILSYSERFSRVAPRIHRRVIAAC
jgi:hypothetical protein